MADFIQQALQRGPEDAPGWLTSTHRRGQQSWQTKNFPTRKTEQWKYTSLRALEKGAYLAKPQRVPVDTDLRERFTIAELEACELVFVNGYFSEALSCGALPEGVELVRFSEATEQQARVIETQLGSVADSDNHMFAALNDSWVADGVFLSVKKGVRVSKPIQIVWLTTQQSEAFSVCQRLLAVVERGGEATVVEHFASDSAQQNSFTNGVTELVVEAGARLYHYRLHLEEENALHIGGVHASLARDATFNSFHLAMGGTLKRIDVVVNHRGEGAHCQLNGVYLPRHQQHVDYHTTIEHAVPHCTTSEVFRGIVGDSGRAVFNGRIHIHPDAQKTLAELSNKNLLTSDKAEVDTKPELEIYADDVQCAHGATVAQLDAQSLHYLCTRGVSRKEAEVMLSFGFINELLSQVAHEPVGDYLRPQLAELFAQESRFARYLV